MNEAQDIFNQALALPESKRAALAHFLLISLEPEEYDPASEAAWNEEIAARSEALERGEIQAHDWRESMARIRQSLSARTREA